MVRNSQTDLTEYYQFRDPPPGTFVDRWARDVVNENMRDLDTILYNFSQRATNNLNQYREPIDSAADLDEFSTGPGNGPKPDTRGRSAVRVSDAGDLPTAADQAAAGDDGTYVILDQETILNGGYFWPNGVDLVDDGGRIVSGTNSGKILVSTLQNAWFDGFEYDGARKVNRLFQGLDADGIQNVHITNCELHGSVFNIIGIAENDERADQTVSKNISLLGNEIYDADGHGAFIGHGRGDNGGAGFERVVMERNHTHDMSGRNSRQGMHLTVYGKPQAPTFNCSISENYCHDGGYESIVFEDFVRDSVMSTNRLLRHDLGGPKVSGAAERNEITDNIVVGGRSGLEAAGQFPHTGDPANNEFYRNQCTDTQFGIRMIEAGCYNVFRYNVFENYDDAIEARDACADQTIEDNTFAK